eukprot:1239555-Amphidinium_carterae.1
MQILCCEGSRSARRTNSSRNQSTTQRVKNQYDKLGCSPSPRLLSVLVPAVQFKHSVAPMTEYSPMSQSFERKTV